MPDAEGPGKARSRGLTWGLLSFVLLAILSGFLGGPGADAYNWLKSKLGDVEEISIGFQDKAGCPSGHLSRIRSFFSDRSVALTNGADNLVICDPESLEALPSDLPRELAKRFPACLSYTARELTLMRDSPAVCQLPGDGIIVCMGQKARHRGDAKFARGKSLMVCSDEVIRDFGF